MVSVNSAKLLLSCSVVKTLLQTNGLQPSRLLSPWDFPGRNAGVSCHFLLQGIFLTQGSNPSFLHWQGFFFFFLQLSHQGSPQLNYPLINRCRDSLFLPTVEENTALEKGMGTEVVEGMPGRWGHGFLGAKEERSRIKMYPATNFQPATHPPTGSHHTQQAGTAITWQVD